ncbi:hypothetical protein M0R45_002277 [Rubus argutus]|uniref:Uncharacterized protein n=1 Tax=Rubus argutus TaxID=59490 RepID=A0AAW1VDE4_RUBAR
MTPVGLRAASSSERNAGRELHRCSSTGTRTGQFLGRAQGGTVAARNGFTAEKTVGHHDETKAERSNLGIS